MVVPCRVAGVGRKVADPAAVPYKVADSVARKAAGLAALSAEVSGMPDWEMGQKVAVVAALMMVAVAPMVASAGAVPPMVVAVQDNPDS